MNDERAHGFLPRFPSQVVAAMIMRLATGRAAATHHLMVPKPAS